MKGLTIAIRSSDDSTFIFENCRNVTYSDGYICFFNGDFIFTKFQISAVKWFDIRYNGI